MSRLGIWTSPRAAVLDEFGVANRSEAEAGRLRTLDAKPLIVLTADRGNSKGWMAAQNEMATLSTNSLHRIESGATHAAFVEDPDDAAAVTRAIHDVVVSVRTGQPLKVPDAGFAVRTSASSGRRDASCGHCWASLSHLYAKGGGASTISLGGSSWAVIGPATR